MKWRERDRERVRERWEEEEAGGRVACNDRNIFIGDASASAQVIKRCTSGGRGQTRVSLLGHAPRCAALPSNETCMSSRLELVRVVHFSCCGGSW